MLLAYDDIARLRGALQNARYTVDGVHELLGPIAHAALHRNETVPATRALEPDDGALATLVRLFLLQRPTPTERVEAALPGLLESLARARILEPDGGQVRARIDIRPYASTEPAIPSSHPPLAAQSSVQRDFWVLADLTPGLDGQRPAVTPDHVLGVNQAATTLAQLTVRRPVERALDLGTGCGIQALHLTGHAAHVTATDVNPRALELATLTAALNGLTDNRLEFRAGSLFEPVADEHFDLIVSNPPFVISPRGDLTYREGGLPGDELCRRIVRDSAAHLAPGGVCQLLANWLHVEGEPWTERLTGWLEPTGLDAWVVQREVSDPAAYVEVWLADAGLRGTPDYATRYTEWLDWFAAQRVEGIGYGWVTLQRPAAEPDAHASVVRLEDHQGPVAQPLGAEIARWLDVARDHPGRLEDADLAGVRLRVAPDVDQEYVGPPGAPDPAVIRIRQRAGFLRTRTLDTAEAGFVGACDGDLTAGQIAQALATLLDPDPSDPSDPGELRARLFATARTLIEEGFLIRDELETPWRPEASGNRT